MEDFSKKKVAELKQALKERGLPTSGTKPELLKRLSEAIGSAAEVEPEVDDNLQDIDDDDILNEDPVPAKPAVAKPPAPAPAKVAVPADSATTNENTKPTEIIADSDSTVKPAAASTLSEAERLKRRAEKFGVVSEQAKKELRAQRFGLPTSNSGTIKSDVPVDFDVLKKRAERFGAVVSSSLSKADEEERKRKRAERFGISGTVSTKSSNGVSSTEDEIKKKKRAERFGLAT